MPRNHFWTAASAAPQLSAPIPKLPRALCLAAAMCAALPALAIDSVATNSPNGAPLSQRIVAYVIDAKLNTDAKTLDATETLEYKNLTGRPLDSFPFHLYLNAFRPESSFSYETHANGGIRAVERLLSAREDWRHRHQSDLRRGLRRSFEIVDLHCAR